MKKKRVHQPQMSLTSACHIGHISKVQCGKFKQRNQKHRSIVINKCVEIKAVGHQWQSFTLISPNGVTQRNAKDVRC